jgi:glutathione S-transferase
MPDKPILWHVWISPYSEKVRWALRHKSIEHERRAQVPGPHILTALRVTRGQQATLPALELDGERIGDSTAIIAALEQRYPEVPLYPSDPVERRRALALEDWFDEQFIPQLRRLFFYEYSRDPACFGELAVVSAPPPLRRFKRAGAAFGHALTATRFGARRRLAAEAELPVLQGVDRLEQELGDSQYLVGDRFTVADLSVAAAMYPLVLPPGAPIRLEQTTETWQRFRAPHRERRAFRWVEEIYSRHRRAERVPVAA